MYIYIYIHRHTYRIYLCKLPSLVHFPKTFLSCTKQLFRTRFPKRAEVQRPSSQGHECCNQHSCRFLGCKTPKPHIFGSNFGGTHLSEAAHVRKICGYSDMQK